MSSAASSIRVHSHQLGNLPQSQVSEDFVDFGVGQPNPGHLSRLLQRLCVDPAAGGLDPLALQYGKRAGDPSFLRALASFLTHFYGASVHASQLMLTNGNSHSLGMVLRCLGAGQNPDSDVVVMDDPTYYLAAAIVRASGARVRLVPMTPQGLDIAALERLLTSLPPASVKAMYISSPCYHNPTGAVMCAETARRLMALADAHKFIVVADEPYTLLPFPGAAERPATSMKVWEAPTAIGAEPEAAPDRAAALERPSSRIISLGSFSKVLGPGLRLGWLHACPRLISALFAADPVVSSSGGFNPFVAHVVHQRLFTSEDGSQAAGSAAPVHALLDELNTEAASKARLLQTELEKAFGDAVEVFAPRGGYFMWARFLDGTDTAAFRSWLLAPQQREQFRVCFMHGARCSAGDDAPDRFRSHFRCTWAFYEAEELAEGVRRLKWAWDVYKSSAVDSSKRARLS